MLFPELKSSEKDSMGPSWSFISGLKRRIFNPPSNKVFVIGFHKTGTSSLGKALQILGYRVCGSIRAAYDFDPDKMPPGYILDRAQPLLENYDAFQDTPWFVFYRELEAMYPDAKFILTIREEDSWIKSIVKHFGGSGGWKFHKWIYGFADPVGHEDVYLKKYRQHNDTVRKYFEGKDNLLEINLKDGRNWEKICPFLGVKIPPFSFPHANAASDKSSLSWKFYSFIKKLTRK